MSALATDLAQPACVNAALALLDPAAAKLTANVQFQIRDGHIVTVADGEGNGRCALPAMVNAHDHGFGISPLGFGCNDDCLECWIPGLAARPDCDPQLEAEVAFGKIALSGVGTTMHCHNSLRLHQLETEAAAVCAAAAKVGMRVGFACPVTDDNAWVYGGPEKLRPLLSEHDFRQLSELAPPGVPGHKQVEQIAAIARRLENPLFSVQYGPIGPQWCKLETLEAIAAASASDGRRVHMHLLESQRQRAWLDYVYPDGVLKTLDAIGLLSSRLTVAHGVWLTDAECELLAARGVTVAMNTACNLRLRSGVAPLARFAEHGVAVALGTDGLSLNDNQDYLTDLRLARQLHNGSGLTEAVPAGDFLRQILDHGFNTVCGATGYGPLAEGACADIVLLDEAALTYDLITGTVQPELIFARMCAAHVRDLFVAGRQIVRDGKLCGFDLTAAQTELIAQAKAAGANGGATQKLIDSKKKAIREHYAQSQ